MEILGTRTEPVTFGDAGGVVARAIRDAQGRLWLSSLQRVALSFEPALSLGAPSVGPALRSPRLWMRQVDAEADALVSLEDLALSLAGPPAEDPGTLRLPSARGPYTRRLRKWFDPGSGDAGYLLRYRDGELVVLTGGVSQSAFVNIASHAVLHVDRRAGMEFRVVAHDAPATVGLDGSGSPNALFMQLSNHSRLVVETARGPSRKFAVDQIVVADQRIRVARFSDEVLTLAREHGPQSRSGLRPTFLRAPGERLTFEIEIPEQAASAPVDSAPARFVYRDPSVSGLRSQLASHQDRFFGLHVRGLRTTSRRYELLDASVASIELVYSTDVPGGASFEFRAGGDIGVGAGRQEPSVLVPKPALRDAKRRRKLEVPLGTLRLMVDEPARALVTGLSFSTEDSALRLHRPMLQGRPLGLSAGATTTLGQVYEPWVMRWDETRGPLSLQSTGEGLAPPADNWTEAFRSVPRAYAILERPGARVSIDQHGPRMVAPASDAERTMVTTLRVDEPTPRECLAYSAFFATLSYVAIECMPDPKTKCLHDDEIQLKERDLAGAAAAAYVKRNGLDDLQLVYHGDHPAPLHAFIEGAVPNADRITWPFAMGLAVLLKEQGGAYCDDIMASRGRPAPILAFDQSNLEKLALADLDWTQCEFDERAERRDALVWPRGSGQPGARLDPSVVFWRGVFMRRMPMVLQLNASARAKLEKFPFLKKLVAVIEERLELEYGWKDETGSSWVASVTAEQPIDFTPSAWRNDLSFAVTRFVTKGSGGKVVASEGEVEIQFLRFTASDGSPLALRSSFEFDVVTGEFARVNAALDLPFATTSIPGFESVRVRRVETDFQSLSLHVSLTASPEVMAALPFLGERNEIDASFAFDLGDSPGFELRLSLPSEIETKLFGKWPLVVQGIAARFGAANDLRFRGQIDLGLGDFTRLGAAVVLRGSGGDWTLDVELSELAGRIQLGAFELAGALSWTKALPASGTPQRDPVPKDQLAGARDRDLWGYLSLGGDVPLGGKLAFRVGSKGELTYWVGYLQLDTPPLPLGPAELREPGLLLAKNASDKDGKLREALANVETSALKRVRPKGDLAAWLAEWAPSSDLGLLVAGSGYFHFNDVVASSPKRAEGEGDDFLTGLLFTDSGLVRLDAYARFMESTVLKWALAIDTRRGRLNVGVRIPAIKIPPVAPHKYVIDPGYFSLGLGYRKPYYFRVGIGWPELLPDSPIERDWSKSVTVKLDDLWPINTFIGGYRAEVDSEKKMLRFGYAVKAGWTKTFEARAPGDVARASAELGLTVGGVVDFTLGWGSAFELAPSPLLTSTMSASATAEHHLVRESSHLAPESVPSEAQGVAAPLRAGELEDAEALAVIMRAKKLADASVIQLNAIDPGLDVALYADAWGKGSAEFLGVTLTSIEVRFYARFRVCGTFRRGISMALARGGFVIEVKIGCVRFRAHAEIDIWLKRGRCQRFTLPTELLLSRSSATAGSER
ncbi:MAG: hypothetical protein CMN31_10745 [Sandaracinus sp.]|nr:hypothetical protein [Sandaracinus sp.]MBJ71801.1 hypothetical protein [Sandaracinus sp.]